MKLDGRGTAIDNFDVDCSTTSLIDINAAGWPVKQDLIVEVSPNVIDSSLVLLSW
jgi:hypothetical protein